LRKKRRKEKTKETRKNLILERQLKNDYQKQVQKKFFCHLEVDSVVSSRRESKTYFATDIDLPFEKFLHEISF